MRAIASASLLAFSLVCSEATGAGIKLEKIRFPSTIDGVKGTSLPPTAAPLSQPIVFEFSGSPVFDTSVSTAIRIVVDADDPTDVLHGSPALGEFEIDGARVVFRPRLPKSPVPDGISPNSDVQSNLGLPGLLPGRRYRIGLEIGTPNAIANLESTKVPLPLKFETKPAVPGPQLVASLFSNASSKPVKVDKKKVKPKPGIDGLYPNPFSDPAGLFSSIPKSRRPPFRLRFDGPVDPQQDNLSTANLRVRAILDAGGLPIDETIASEAFLTSNSLSGATVAIAPLSILPFGATVAVEIADTFRALSGASSFDGTAPPAFKEIARWRVALDPEPGQPVDDALFEGFDDVAHEDSSLTITEGKQLAGWDAGGSGVLRASFGFGGDGSLGRFLPPNIETTINLDTDFQPFPLLSGATPDAVPGTEVKGGVFHFTSFHLPSLVTLRARGSRPLQISCTGDCVIEGMIDVDGADGTEDDTYDSAITVAPGGRGGPGGGSGGDGHPVKVSKGFVLFGLQTPQFGGTGSGPGKLDTGGRGGQSGCTMPWIGFESPQCLKWFAEAGDGSRGSGGGGGMFKPFLPNAGSTSTNGLGPEPDGVPVSARRGAIGIGNHLPVEFDPGQPIPGEPIAYEAVPGNPFNAVARPNPNPTFAEAYAAGMIFDDAPFLEIGSTWTTSKRVLLYGEPGDRVFVDSDDENDFIGPGGELAEIRGGQGGGAGGSRTEGLSQICKPMLLQPPAYPFTSLDAKGGGGGGGGGALRLQALGTIELRGEHARILARGGRGRGAEEIGKSSRGGAGGGGSGGCVILQSAIAVVMDDPDLPDPSEGGYVIDVSPGTGAKASTLAANPAIGTAGGDPSSLQVGDGGPGGPGIVQIHAPDVAHVDAARIGADVNYSMFNMRDETVVINQVTFEEGLDHFQPLVPFAKTPAPLTSKSTARSTWYDLGAGASELRPPIATSAGALDGPLFGVPGEGPFFAGTDPVTGLVATDSIGNVLLPYTTDVEVDSPDVAKADFVPNGPVAYQTVRVEFQGADEDEEAPGLPDLSSSTPWVTDATLLNGRRFVRWQITFDIAANPAFPVKPGTPRPQVNFLRVPFQY